MTPDEKLLHTLERSVETWDLNLMRKSLPQALDAGISPETIISDGLAKGMDKVSQEFDVGDLYLPQVLAASKVMDEAMLLLSDHINTDSERYRGVVVMGTVSGDIHEIGKNVCIAMLRGARYRVVDLGPDVSPEEFIKAVKENSADAVGGSALMTTTLDMQRKMVHEKEENDCNVLMLFGGAPCTEEWVKSIHGDGYSSSGRDMVLLLDKKLDAEGHK